MIRIFYVSLFMSLALALMALYGGAEYRDLMRYVVQILITLQFGLITLVVPSLCTASITSELENGTFEHLRLTPLSAGRIFWGKLLPTLMPALLPMIALLPAYGALVVIDPSFIPHLSAVAPVILLAVLAMCILGLTCSVLASTTARATVAAYLIACTAMVGPVVVWWAAEGQLLSITTARWVAMFSPLAISLNLLPDSRVQIGELVGYHLVIAGGACLVLLVIARGRLAARLREG